MSQRQSTASPSAALLTMPEKKLIADTLSDVGSRLASSPSHLAQLLAGGLEVEVADAMGFNEYDRKWRVDGQALLAKLHRMDGESKRHLITTIGGIWDRDDENFDSDLEACVV